MGLINKRGRTLQATLYEAASYASPTSCVIARDARLDYLPGNIVAVPGSPETYAAVIIAVYSSPNTTVYFSGKVCFPGMTNIGLVNPRRSLCAPANGTASMPTGVSSGTAAAACLCQIDGVSQCLSTQTDSGVAGVSRFVFQFSTARRIGWLGLCQIHPGAVASVKLGYSSDNIAWTDHVTLSNLANYAENYMQFRSFEPPTSAYTWWRVLANAAPASGNWRLNSIAMGE